MLSRFIIVATMLFIAGTVYADDQQLTMLNKHDFIAMKSQVSKDFDQDKRYREITPADQEAVKKTLARMEMRWQKAEETAQLSQDDRIEMVNDEQLVDTILQHAAVDSRTVCERTEPIGSHRPQSNCRTVAQIKREQEKAQSSMRDGKTGTN